MAQADGVVANGTGAAVRADLNDQLAAVFTNHSGSSEPATTYAYQWWADTTANVLKIRNSANNAWITLRELDGTMLIEDGSASTPGLSFASDTNSGLFGGSDTIGFATGGAERLEIGSSEVVFNDISADTDFRVESNGQTHMLFVDAGNDAVGIGSSAPGNFSSSANDLVVAGGSSTGISIATDSASGNSRIYFADGTSGSANRSGQINYEHTDNVMWFATGASEALRIDSSGRLLVGTSSARTNFYNTTTYGSQLLIEQAGIAEATYAQAAFVRNSNNSNGSEIIIGKTRGTTVNSATAVQAADTLGVIRFQGADGTNMVVGAEIVAAVDSTPGADDMPTALTFRTTADGASSSTERLRIDSSGHVGIATASPTTPLSVRASSNITTYGEVSAQFSDNSTGSLYVQHSSGKVQLGSDAALAFGSGTSATEAVRIDSSGRVLAGTSSTSMVTRAVFHGSSAGSGSGGSILIARDQATPSDGAALGTIFFSASNHSQAARIGVARDGGTWTAGSSQPSRLEFATTANGASSPSERMRIVSTGRIQMSNAGSYYTSGEVLSVSTSNNGTVHVGRNTNASFSNDVLYYYVSRSSNSAFSYLKFAASAGGDNDFHLRGDGNAYADGSWNAGGADYAEYFEWFDGNTETEDRRGISVVLDGDKIREAVAGEEPIGVISGNPSVVGDSDIDRWKGKYLRDDFGTYLQDTHSVVEWNETITDSEGNQSTKKHSYEDWNIPDGIVVPDDAVVSATDENGQPYTHRRLNPDYNPDTAYISREDRAEWDTVGLMGKLRIRKGQVTGTRWIKMRDVSDTVEEWLVR